MAPVENDSDNRISARKNFCIVFLHFGREFESRLTHGMRRDGHSDCMGGEPRQRANQKRW
jgi:hypothetical protein